MTADERTPYLKCLIHEIKKVYKKWLVLVGVLGVGYVLWAGRDEILRGFEQIGNWFNASVQAALSSVPWWLWVLIGIFVAPVIYAAVKCLWIRYKNMKHYISMVIGGILGFFIGLGIVWFIVVIKPIPLDSGDIFFAMIIVVYCFVSGIIIGHITGED